MLGFEYPIRPFTFGPKSSPFFAMPYLAVGGVGLGRGVGVAGRWARRHAAPAVVGRFIFFRDLAFFGDSERSGFGDTDDGRTDETGLPPDPLLRTENRQNFIAKIFLAILKKRVLVVPLNAGQMLVVVVSGGEFAVASHDRRHARPRLAVLLPPSSPVSPLL